MNNKYLKIFFWVFPIIFLANIVADLSTIFTKRWDDLLVGIPTIYFGIPLSIAYVIYFIILSVKKKTDSHDRIYFVIFVLLIIMYIFILPSVFSLLDSYVYSSR